MCKDVRNSYIVHKLGIQRVPYDIRNYAVMRVFGIFLWGSPLKCHGDIMRVYDFKRLGTLEITPLGFFLDIIVNWSGNTMGQKKWTPPARS